MDSLSIIMYSMDIYNRNDYNTDLYSTKVVML